MAQHDSKVIDEMVREVTHRRTPSVPLHETTAEVFGDYADELQTDDQAELEEAGFRALARMGHVPVTPSGREVFPTEAAEKLGDSYDPDVLTDEERAQLAYVGFEGIVADALAESEVEE